MSVKLNGAEIVLEDRCGVEEAEALLAGLVANPGATVTLRATHVHTALWQVLMAMRPKVEGSAPDPFSARFVLSLLNAPGRVSLDNQAELER